jgi:hypothetical protein
MSRDRFNTFASSNGHAMRITALDDDFGTHGNGNLRCLFIHGARAVCRHHCRRPHRLGRWLTRLEAREHPNMFIVACPINGAHRPGGLAARRVLRRPAPRECHCGAGGGDPVTVTPTDICELQITDDRTVHRRVLIACLLKRSLMRPPGS